MEAGVLVAVLAGRVPPYGTGVGFIADGQIIGHCIWAEQPEGVVNG